MSEPRFYDLSNPAPPPSEVIQLSQQIGEDQPQQPLQQLAELAPVPEPAPPTELPAAIPEQQLLKQDQVRVKRANQSQSAGGSSSSSSTYEYPRYFHIIKVDFKRTPAIHYPSYIQEKIDQFEEENTQEASPLRRLVSPSKDNNNEVIEISDDNSSAAEDGDLDVKQTEYITEEVAKTLMMNQKNKNNMKYEDLVVGLMERLAAKGSIVDRLPKVVNSSEDMASQVSEEPQQQQLPLQVRQLIPKTQLHPITEEMSDSLAAAAAQSIQPPPPVPATQPLPAIPPLQDQQPEQEKKQPQVPRDEAYEIGDYDFEDSWIDDQEEMHQPDQVTELQRKWLAGELPKNFKLPKCLQRYQGDHINQLFKETEELQKFADLPLEKRYAAVKHQEDSKLKLQRDLYGKQFYQIDSSDAESINLGQGGEEPLIPPPRAPPGFGERVVPEKKKRLNVLGQLKKAAKINNPIQSGSESEGVQLSKALLETGPVVDTERLIENYSGPAKDEILSVYQIIKELMRGSNKQSGKKSDSPEREGVKSRKLQNLKKRHLGDIEKILHKHEPHIKDKAVQLISKVLEKSQEKTEEILKENYLWMIKEDANNNLKQNSSAIQRRLKVETVVVSELLVQEKFLEIEALSKKCAQANLRYRSYRKETSSSTRKKVKDAADNQEIKSSPESLQVMQNAELKKHLDKWVRAAATPEIRSKLIVLLENRYPFASFEQVLPNPSQAAEDADAEPDRLKPPAAPEVIVLTDEEAGGNSPVKKA